MTGGVIHRGQAREHCFQVRGRDFRGATGVAHQAGELQLGEVHRVRALARAGADALLSEYVAGQARGSQMQCPRRCERSITRRRLAKINLHFSSLRASTPGVRSCPERTVNRTLSR